MKIKDTPKEAKNLFEISNAYINARFQLYNISLGTNLVRLLSGVISIYFLLFVLSFFLLFISLGLGFWLGKYLGDLHFGFLIVAGFYLLLALVLFVFRKAIFLNPLIKRLSKIIFRDAISENYEYVEIKNIRDVEREKKKLKKLISELEYDIKYQYDEILDAFRIQNIKTSIAEKIPGTREIIIQAIEIAIQMFSGRRRK